MSTRSKHIQGKYKKKKKKKDCEVVKMLWCGSLNPIIVQGPVHRRRLCSRAQGDGVATAKKKKKVVVVGSGWAGLGAAHHLCNQVTINISLCYSDILISNFICSFLS